MQPFYIQQLNGLELELEKEKRRKSMNDGVKNIKEDDDDDDDKRTIDNIKKDNNNERNDYNVSIKNGNIKNNEAEELRLEMKLLRRRLEEVHEVVLLFVFIMLYQFQKLKKNRVK